MSWWDTALDWGGKAMDWVGDNPELSETLMNSIGRLASDYPEMSMEELMQLAMQEQVMQNPDIFTPSGSSTTQIDPDTGKATVTQAYTPQIQALFESLVGQAGAPSDVYQNPEHMGQDMLGGLMNERLRHMGLPEKPFERRDLSQPGFDIPDFTTTPTTNSASVGGGPMGAGGHGEIGSGGTGAARHWEKTGEVNATADRAAIGGIEAFADWSQRNHGSYDFSSQGGLNKAIDDFVLTQPNLTPIQISKLQEFALTHAPTIGRIAGGLTGVQGGSTIGKWMGKLAQNWFYNNYALQNPADLPPGPLSEQAIDDWMNYGTDPQQSSMEGGGPSGFERSFGMNIGGGRVGVPAFGSSGGPWYRDVDTGRISFSRSGYVPPNGSDQVVVYPNIKG